MPTRTKLATGLLLAGLCAAWGADPALQQEIATLVSQLGSPSYRTRERATKRLWRIGPPARTALEAAANSKDLEVAARAKLLLKDIRSGIRPDWPVEIIAAARNFEWGTSTARRAAMDKICKALKGGSLDFLLSRLAAGDGKDAAHALQWVRKLASDDAKIYPAVLGRIREPKNQYEGQAVVLARVSAGETIAALKVLSQYKIGSSQRQEIIEAGVKNLLKLLAKYEFDKAAEEAAQFCAAAPADGRFLYLRAEALGALEKDEQADRLRKKALALHPAAEAPHYTAGEMLQHKLHRRALALGEWNRILEMPPHKSVYDMNALMRLHSIYAACGMFDRAADCLARGVEMVEAARKRSSGVGLIGGTPAGLRRRVEDLRARARRSPAGADAKVTDARPDDGVSLNISVSVKDGKLTELRQALGQVAATMTVNIQPRGLRLLDKGPLSVRYDAGKQQIGVYLNNSRCSAPAPLRLRGKGAKVAIRSLDCYYIFQVDAKGGQATKLARFEKDYTLRLRPGNKVAACKDVTVTINGKSYQWARLLADGAAFDYLPARLQVAIEGARPSGRPLSMKFNITPVEPAIKPLATPPKAAP